MLTLTHLLQAGGIDPARIMAMRHRLAAPAPRRAWPDLFDAYQGIQTGRGAAAAGACWLVGCSGETPGEAVFLGLWRVAGSETVPAAEADGPAMRELEAIAGGGASPLPETVTRLHLEPQPRFDACWLKLILGRPGGERNWHQWERPGRFPIAAIPRAEEVDPPVPLWRGRVRGWAEPAALPQSWETARRQGRGVYHILDCGTGRGHADGAGGEENLPGRRGEPCPERPWREPRADRGAVRKPAPLDPRAGVARPADRRASGAGGGLEDAPRHPRIWAGPRLSGWPGQAGTLKGWMAPARPLLRPGCVSRRPSVPLARARPAAPTSALADAGDIS